MITASQASPVLKTVAESPLQGARLRKLAMEQLSGIAGYDWCGIYRLEGSMLVLDEYVGAPTDHARISVGVGVCGTAVAEDRTMIVEDVRKVDNYLACSISTRSEIVVLIRDKKGKVLGQIDIDGHEAGAFDLSDERFLQSLGDLLASRWE